MQVAALKAQALFLLPSWAWGCEMSPAVSELASQTVNGEETPAASLVMMQEIEIQVPDLGIALKSFLQK